MVRKRVTLFIVDVAEDEVLMIHRHRSGQDYYIVPGGGVEPGETIVEAAHREAAEETSLTIKLGPQLWQRPFTTPMSNGQQIEQLEYAYLVTQFNGTPRLSGPEFERQTETNRYDLEWMSLDDFPDRVVYPCDPDKTKLLAALNGRF